MRLLKGILAFALTVILFACSVLALGSYAVSEAISENAVEKAIRQTDAVEQLTDTIIQQNTINLGGSYGEMMQSILQSDAMTDFFTAYTARSLRSQIYGTEMEEIGADDLNAAFSSGVDECIADGSISMNKGERIIFDQALNLAMPNLTMGVNFVLRQMDLMDFVDEDTAGQIEMVRALTSDEVKYGMTGIAIMTCLVLFALQWRSKMGFLLSGMIVLVATAVLYYAMTVAGETIGTGGDEALSNQMAGVMLTYGLKAAVKAGAAAGAAMVVACPVFKVMFRRKRR